MPQFSEDDVRDRINDAIRLLQRRDAYLLEHDANERSITHRLAIYVEGQFPGWDVDCEYNRDGADPKRLPRAQTVQTDDDQGRTVYPDIIVHKRGRNNDPGSNLLVIEVKKSPGGVAVEQAIGKLRGFTQQSGYRYDYALLLRIGVRSRRSENPGVCFITLEPSPDEAENCR